MPFKFRYLCDLLQSLHDNRVQKATSRGRVHNADVPIIVSWFNKHDRDIPRHGPPAVAFLSCLFPERRADRVYNVQEKRLEKIIGRCLGLQATRLKHLASWRAPNGLEFSETVRNVMAEAEFDRPRPEHQVTLEEIDALFDRIAAFYGSSPDLKMRISDPIPADEALPTLFRRLQSSEAKWLIRMFLKRWVTIEVPEAIAMRQFHCLLPDILRLQSSFMAAIKCLEQPIVSGLCKRPMSEAHERAIKLQAAAHLKPEVGVMVQRAPYYKARSVQHCCDMAGRRRMSVERKYDGEYCQIHIDQSNRNSPVKVFSKSGKDSTNDRIRIRGAIEAALRLGKKDCPIKKQCILEGELLIWHEKDKRILPFDKIRKHVTRNGRFLGNEQDSPRDLQEHPMVMFYDILLLDSFVCLHEPLEQRRSRLRSLLRRIPGLADLGYREKIDFASSDAKSLIRKAFARCISLGWEGFVLKGRDDPYFFPAGGQPSIKLKKDYITGLGDTADLAIIGGRRDARDEQVLQIGRLTWTTFYLGCLKNRDEVRRFAARPRFHVVGVVSHANQTLTQDRTRLFNELGRFERVPYNPVGGDVEIILDQQIEPLTDVFKNPFVVEVVGSGFEKPPNTEHRTLRFPRVTKVHQDRAWHDILTFDELQELATNAESIAQDEDSQGDREWIEKLIAADPRSRFVDQNSAESREQGQCTGVSIIPSVHCASSSPVLVRIDTQELTEHERALREGLEDAMENPSSASPTATMNTLKRKEVMQANDSTTGVSNKRRKLAAQNTGAACANMCQNGKPDWVTRDLCTRQPLVEIGNSRLASKRSIIPSQDVKRAEQTPPTHEDTAGPRMPPDTILLVEPSASHTKGRMTEIAPLPISPTWSVEEVWERSVIGASAGDCRSDRLRDMTTKCIRTSVETKPPLEKMHHDRMAVSFDLFQACSSQVFLTSTVATIMSGSKSEVGFLLARIGASFTFSSELFLDGLQSVSRQPHIAIINLANPGEAGKDIGRFHQTVSNRLKDGPLTREGRIIFFDLQVLEMWGTNFSSKWPLQRFFGGCLVWDATLNANRQVVSNIRPIWNWDEVTEMLTG